MKCRAASQVLGTSPVRSDLQQYLSVLAVLLFVSLYALQALIIAQPEGALARRLYPLAFAGFYLDEHFTRLTFRLWPLARPQHATSATGESQ